MLGDKVPRVKSFNLDKKILAQAGEGGLLLSRYNFFQGKSVTSHGELLRLSGKVVKNEKINEIERTRVRSHPGQPLKKVSRVNAASFQLFLPCVFPSRDREELVRPLRLQGGRRVGVSR
jgi:hypothetical protein